MTKNRQIPISLKLILIFCACYFIGTINGTGAKAAEKLTISLVGIEAGFPEIRANVRIVDGTNRVPESIDPNDLEVYENGVRIEDFEIVPAQSSPQLVAVYIDSGINTQYLREFGANSIRKGLSDLTSSEYFEAGKDQVLLNERKNVNQVDQTIRHISAEDQLADLSLALSRITFAPGVNSTESFIGLDETLTQISETVGGKISTPTSLIFFYHNVNWPPTTQQVRLARAMSDKARLQGTRIYVVHANPSGAFSEPFEDMAKDSGGIYINLSAADEPEDRLPEIYRDLEPQTQSFVIRFNSSIIEPGAREIAIVPAGVPIRESTAIGSVNVSPTPVSIIVETSESVNRSAIEVDGAFVYSPDNSPVLAQVESWPYPLVDGDLVNAELFVNGVSVDQVSDPDPENIIFGLDVSGIETNQNLLVQVRITDKTGLIFKSASSQVQVTVERPISETISEEVVIEDVEPTVVPPTATPFIIVSDPEPESATFLDLLPWLLTVLMLLLLIGFSIFFLRRLNALEAGVARQAYESGGLLHLTRTIITGPVRGSVALATLEILQGPEELTGKKVEIFTHNVNIGRDPRRCDILIYDGDEHSSVSALHCVIQFDQGEFKITDGSSNGTRLNNEFLQTDLPSSLNSGDEIILGDLFKRGAMLKFEIAEGGEEAKSAAEKQRMSLAKLNLVGRDDDEELIESSESGESNQAADDSSEPDNGGAVQPKQTDSNDESWMDSLE